MLKTYEFWVVYEDDGIAYTLGTTEQIELQRAKGILEPGAELKFRIQAETYEEACAVRNIKLGWSPYVPNGAAADCPNGYGGLFYPAGYAECPNATDFTCTLELTIGPANEQGAEQFYLTVCTPKSLARECEKEGFVWGRHRLVIAEYNLESILDRTRRLVQRFSGESWKVIAEKLGRFASWEFEDYRP